MIEDIQIFKNLGIADIHQKVMDGERLSREDGIRLFECPNPLALGALAHHRRTELHGDKAFYVINQHINYTNICVNACTFCAYQREDGQEGGFFLTVDDMLTKVRENPAPPTEIHIVGGCHPKLPLAHFEEMLSSIRAEYPDAVLKCFTAVEIAHFAKLEDITTREVLVRLQNAGLNMLPGGGAEIFAEPVRSQICPRKIGADDWLRVHEEAHSLGLKTNCTMLFGHLENEADRVDHLLRLREAQDKHHGFTCFIPLPFLTENNELKIDRPLTGLDELRTIAVSRLMLDNIAHVKAYWVMLTVKQAQAALYWGADDFDGTVVEEKIGHMAGATSQQCMNRAELEEMIRGCGFTPVQRDSYFNPMHQA